MRALHLVLTVLFQTLRVLGRSRSDLILENLALRLQVSDKRRTSIGERQGLSGHGLQGLRLPAQGLQGFLLPPQGFVVAAETGL